MCIYQCYSLSSSHLFLPWLCPQVCSLCLCLYFFPANRFHQYHFSRFCIYALTYNACSSLSDLLHSVWQTLGSSTSLQMTHFYSFYGWIVFHRGLPWWLGNKSAYQCRSLRFERAPGEGNDSPLQYSCQGNPMDRGIWRATVHGLQRNRHDLTTKQQYIPLYKCITTSLSIRLSMDI